ncbi:hypothetical protein L1887_56032 [Cichorium endivia]|nr:hypothetical protein L1887_56032 [Cichorium endivia]
MAANVDTLHEFSAPRQGAICQFQRKRLAHTQARLSRCGPLRQPWAKTSALVSLKRACNQRRTRRLRTARRNLDERALRKAKPRLGCARFKVVTFRLHRRRRRRRRRSTPLPPALGRICRPTAASLDAADLASGARHAVGAESGRTSGNTNRQAESVDRANQLSAVCSNENNHPVCEQREGANHCDSHRIRCKAAAQPLPSASTMGRAPQSGKQNGSSLDLRGAAA